jgi:transcriptional regulator with XRE-family HTH domain
MRCRRCGLALSSGNTGRLCGACATALRARPGASQRLTVPAAVLTRPEVLAALADWRWGEVLAVLQRSDVGFSQSAISRATGLSQSTISRLSSGKSASPNLQTVRSLCAGLGIPLVMAGLAPVEDLTEHAEEAETDRRTFLTSAVFATLGLTNLGEALTAREHIPLGDELESLRRAAPDLLRMNDEEGGTARLCQLSAWLIERTEGVLHNHKASQRDRSAARELTIELAMQAGWLHYDAGDQRAARHYWQHALFQAEMAEDSEGQVYALQSLAVQATYGLARPMEALDFTNRAQRIATGEWLSPKLRSLLLMRQSNAHAELKDKRASLAAYQAAARCLSQESNAEQPRWVDFYDEAELEGLLALAYRSMGEFSTARAHLIEIEGRLPEHMLRNRLYYTAVLARCSAEMGDTSAAADVLLPKLEAIRSTGSWRTHKHVKSVLRQAGESGSTAARGLLAAAHDYHMIGDLR